MPEGEFLLINNNNTRTKFALADREALLANTSVMSKDLTDDGITAALEDWDYENVVLASVVPSSLSVLMASQKGRKTVQVNHEIELGVDIDFPDPSTVGADRRTTKLFRQARRLADRSRTHTGNFLTTRCTADHASVN